MKEEELKKIIRKSKIETSDDFINQLMNTIEIDKEVSKASYWWSFRSIIIGCTILVLAITFILFKFLNSDNILLNNFTDIPKTPIFIMVILIILFYINTIIKLNENMGNLKNKA